MTQGFCNWVSARAARPVDPEHDRTAVWSAVVVKPNKDMTFHPYVDHRGYTGAFTITAVARAPAHDHQGQMALGRAGRRAVGNDGAVELATQHMANRLGHHPRSATPCLAFMSRSAGSPGRTNPGRRVQLGLPAPELRRGGCAAGVCGWRRRRQHAPRKTTQAFRDVHGSADWATLDDIEAMGCWTTRPASMSAHSKIPQTGTVHYLRDTTGAHVSGIAPTRSRQGPRPGAAEPAVLAREPVRLRSQGRTLATDRRLAEVDRPERHPLGAGRPGPPAASTSSTTSGSARNSKSPTRKTSPPC